MRTTMKQHVNVWLKSTNEFHCLIKSLIRIINKLFLLIKMLRSWFQVRLQFRICRANVCRNNGHSKGSWLLVKHGSSTQTIDGGFLTPSTYNLIVQLLYLLCALLNVVLNSKCFIFFWYLSKNEKTQVLFSVIISAY